MNEQREQTFTEAYNSWSTHQQNLVWQAFEDAKKTKTHPVSGFDCCPHCMCDVFDFKPENWYYITVCIKCGREVKLPK